MKRFVVSLSRLDIATESEFRDLMGENSFGFWHRMPGIWLLSTPDEVTAENLRDMIGHRFGAGLHMIVVENGMTAVRVPMSQGDWFLKHWGIVLKPVDENVDAKKE